MSTQNSYAKIPREDLQHQITAVWHRNIVVIDLNLLGLFFPGEYILHVSKVSLFLVPWSKIGKNLWTGSRGRKCDTKGSKRRGSRSTWFDLHRFMIPESGFMSIDGFLFFTTEDRKFPRWVLHAHTTFPLSPILSPFSNPSSPLFLFLLSPSFSNGKYRRAEWRHQSFVGSLSFSFPLIPSSLSASAFWCSLRFIPQQWSCSQA